MAQVVLIGDSIRMGYEAVVREVLSGVSVWSPEQNGGDSSRVRENLKAWAIVHNPKVVHLNCGLHDLKKDFETGTAQVPIEQYEENLRAILSRLQGETEARVVFALTTPVNEEWHHARKGFDRFEADVVSYNHVAQTICDELDIVVNDLFSVVVNAGRDRLLKPDGVHFGDEGCELLGKTVAGVIQDKR